MAFEQSFAHHSKSISAAATEPENISGCFDCNICLDFARDPVVTLCGHLYCWPCIYEWASLSSDEHPQCPVCKAKISHTTVVPLYGRGSDTPKEAEFEGKPPSIPPRPSACGTQALITTSQFIHRSPSPNEQYYEENSSTLSFSGGMEMGVFHPGMLGEMVYARVFGNSESLYAYPNSYHLIGSSSPWLRRQEVQADRSLHRISVFLFFCFLLCLVLF